MRPFLDPRSVVLIGVHHRVGPGTYNNFDVMVRYGYSGKLYVVHPHVSEIGGRKAYPSVAALPDIPELAVISVGRDQVLSVFKECVQKGIRHVVVMSQGFADADYTGKRLQKELALLAQRYSVRVLGPNTMGVLNAFSGFTTSYLDIVRDPSPIPISLIVQSGAFLIGFESFTGRLGKAIDLGNACNVCFTDVLNFLEHDTQTQVIVLHMEDLRRGRRFLRTAHRIARKKPIIVLKSGRSAAGAKAAFAHTGAQVALSQTEMLAEEDKIFDQAFDQAGLIRVRNIGDLRSVCQSFLHLQPMKGPRLAVVTISGACGVLTADACEDFGMELAPFPENLRNQLENPYLAWHHLNNPVDIGVLGLVAGSMGKVFKDAVQKLLQENQIDGVLGIFHAHSSPLHPDLYIVSLIREILKNDNPQHKPIALWLCGDGAARQREALADDRDVACYSSLDEAILGLAALWKYTSFQKRPVNEQAFCKLPPVSPSRLVPPPPGEILLGEKALELLKHYEIPVVSGTVVQSSSEARMFAEQSGYPLVVKILSPEWIHKSDWGGVRTNIRNDAELEAALIDLKEHFTAYTPQGTLTGFWIQKYVQGTELFFGIKRDRRFGPVVLTGKGGIYAQVFKDIATAVAPVDKSRAEAMIKSLQIYPILKGVRGQDEVGLSILVQILMSLSRLAMEYPEILELDIDPVVATAKGSWGADCRIVFC
jgi:acetyltransferase